MRVPASRRVLRPRWWMFAVAAVLVVIAGAALYLRIRPQHPPRDDVAIIDAMIYDGTGAAPFRGGIAVRGSRIVAVWHGWRWRRLISAGQIIDAGGHVLSPGFIDTHTHADFSIGESSSPIRAPNFVSQGVTTLIAGNCGRSPKDFGGFRDLVEFRGADVNIAVLSGMNTIRAAVMGDSPAAPSRQQLDAMLQLLERQMRQGAIGVSTGLEYVPGRFATRTEMLELLRVAARHHAVHTTHMRNEGRFVVESAREVMSLSAEAGIPLLISHLKVAGRTNCHCFDSLLALIRTYRSTHPLYFDQYPYAASSTNLDIYLPDWFLRAGTRERHHVLRTGRDAVKADIATRLQQDGFADLTFARVVKVASHPDWSGLTIRAIDRRLRGGTELDSQLDVMLDLVDRGGSQMVYHNICPDVVERIQETLAPMVGSDSTIRGRNPDGAPHPRGWGTFAKFLGYSVRERHVATLAEAIRRMTDLPARFFGLTGRGRIAPGYFADLVLFDADAIDSRASYRHPFREPVGIDAVFVNGVCVKWRASLTDASPGVFIARNDRMRRRGDGLVASTLLPTPRRPLRQ